MSASGASDTPCWARGWRARTEDLPALALELPSEPEAFVVEELPLYPPAGGGDHVLLEIEKRGLATDEAVRRLARALGRPQRAFGTAGRKDARAVARQWISVEHADLDAARALELPGLRVLSAERHDRKLRRGHLRGNRFRLSLVGPDAGRAEVARAVLEALTVRGLPSWFGPQRFGRDGRNAEHGARLAAGDARGYVLGLLAAEGAGAAAAELRERLLAGRAPTRGDAARWWRALDPPLRPLARAAHARPDDWAGLLRAVPRPVREIHGAALQAAVFQRVLSARFDDVARPSAGDVVTLHERGASFVVADEGEARERAASFELSLSGPLPGAKLLRPTSPSARALEDEALAAHGLALEDLRGLRGSRRAMRVPLREPRAESAGGPGEERLVVGFALPPGAYATAVLAELTKSFPAPARTGGGSLQGLAEGDR